MTFLNSALLAALTLGVLPILIHLLNRQRFKTVEFPTLKFLRELQRQKMRQVKVRQILLLILRTLAVLCLVLALTRPVINSAAGILPGAEARTTAVIILDRSASMLTETSSGTRFRVLQTRAQEILALLHDGDEAQIVWADNAPELFPESPTGNIRLLRETVSEATPLQQGGNLVLALQQARQILGQSHNLHKEVYVLSDFSESALPDKLPDSPLLPEDIRVFACVVGDDRVNNVAIVDASITSRLITPGRAVELSTSVKNTGGDAAADRILSVYLAGRRVAQSRITLAAGEQKSVRLKFVPEDPGDQAGYVSLEEADDFSQDNRRYFVLRVPANLQVAVAGADGPARNLTALALNPTQDPAGFVQPHTLTLAEFESEDWSQFDAIFLVDAPSFVSEISSRLRSFAESGKGVLVSLGPNSDPKSSAAWLAALGLPVPGEIRNLSDSPLKWSQTDLAHPLFEGLFEEKPSNISPEIFQIATTRANGAAVEVVSISQTLPFLWESRVGRGRALLMTSSPDPGWSTLFRSGIFAPLLVSSAAYLAGVGTSGQDYQLIAGEFKDIFVGGYATSTSFELRGETTQVSPVAVAATGGVVLRIAPFTQPQSAELMHDNQRMSAVVVNLAAKESDIKAVPAANYQGIVGGRFAFLEPGRQTEQSVMEGRFGRELWKLFLGIALALLIAEMLLGRAGKSEATMAAS